MDVKCCNSCQRRVVEIEGGVPWGAFEVCGKGHWEGGLDCDMPPWLDDGVPFVDPWVDCKDYVAAID